MNQITKAIYNPKLRWLWHLLYWFLFFSKDLFETMNKDYQVTKFNFALLIAFKLAIVYFFIYVILDIEVQNSNNWKTILAFLVCFTLVFLIALHINPINGRISFSSYWERIYHHTSLLVCPIAIKALKFYYLKSKGLTEDRI